ncbi:PLP-dependent transferase [Aaosphaeria arxii CBS 175.79]|uniref:PLP-dependent transferase n=1 Tax=Aaosphaeria arxii CBS 175.79 TaxID=1450172 RepID=A0A6A5XB00_9PLEO|nr:PLP-dependent transferase [Aaosphaeria arxii CBS 175.79]KAF2009967.1 PLP-dependent transferase [Aaosphaeria arxii CBS 175.79]
MDGDVAKLREIVEMVERTLPRGTGHVVVDEAHSTGVLGPQGRGLVCELGLEDRVFARLHTFGKALACNGAIILCSPLLRHYLINYARPLIYTTSLSYPALAAIRTSYRLLPLLGQQEGEEDPRTHLFNLISQLFTSLTALVDTDSSSNADGDIRTLIQVPKTCPSSPIFAVQTPEPRQLAAFLQARGMMVRAVVAPTVAEGTERVRVCLHAGNTKGEVETLVDGIGEWARGRAKARARL